MNELNLLEYVNEWLTYAPDTGKFYWKKSSNRGVRQAGKETGTANCNGYRVLKLQGVQHRAHRIAFLLMEQRLPLMIDHIDRNRSNNKWTNLREVTAQENCLNRSRDVRNTTGVTGVHFFKRENVFTVTYGKNYLGRSKDFFEAVCIRKTKEKGI